jgi:hypothetical protein
MRCMSISQWVKISTATIVATAVLATSSMAALTGPALSGELTVGGGNAEGKTVLVNGEPATTGRTVIGSSTIVTPENVTATINFGKAGKIQLAPGTTFTIGSSLESLQGDLTAGDITVLNAANVVNVKTLTGDTVEINAGETASAASSAAQTNKQGGIGPKTWYAIIAVASVAALIAIALHDSHRAGGVTSPIR